MPSTSSFAALTLLALAALAPVAATGAQEPRPLSLADAVRMAHGSSEALVVARAAIDDATGERVRAAGAKRMRLDAFSLVDRALRSEYDGIDFGMPAGDAGAGDALPFGSPTTYRMGFTLSQPVWTGGRATALARAASRAQRAAGHALAAAAAAVTLDAAQAYYDAALAEQAVAIAEGTLEQADSALALTQRTLDAGRASEYATLRARVARDRQRSALVRQRGERDVAMLRLQQVVNVPAGTPLFLTTTLEPSLDLPAVARAMWPASLDGRDEAAGAREAAPRAAIADYVVVREAAARVQQQRYLVSAARAERMPGVALTSTWERVAYARGDLPANRDFRTNWTLGARVDLPILSAGRQPADEAQARAGLLAASAELRRSEEMSLLATRTAAARLAAAEAAWGATTGVVEQAVRTHDIARLRHREGLATQLELDDARLALQAARTERARAGRDLLVERLRVALLPALPPLATTAAR